VKTRGKGLNGLSAQNIFGSQLSQVLAVFLMVTMAVENEYGFNRGGILVKFYGRGN
jgi:hypothetical protein